MSIVKDRPFLSTGSFRELVRLFAPILLMTFSSCLFLFVEKLLLARLSLDAMEAAINAAYASQIFQAPTVALAMMAQVFVGQWRGAREWTSIGPGVWQFIWFSLLSMIITIPVSLYYGQSYFHGTNIEGIVLPYFYVLVSINFLYPLAATLSCFYIGQGRTRLILWSTVGSQLLKLLVAYPLIFGWSNWIPGLGIMGGAISTVIVQGSFCILLLWIFLNKEHAATFHSRNWSFKPKLFWECIHPGILRAVNRTLVVVSWASIAHLMTLKGGDYLLVLSIGGTLVLFLPFLGDAISQAQITVVSNILGGKNYHLLNKAFRSASALTLITILILSIPLLILPLQTFYYLFPGISLDDATIRMVLFGVWVSFACFTFAYVPISYILAFKDTQFSLFMGGMSWINGYLLMYIAIEKIQISADKFWLVLSLMNGSTALLYFWRMKWLQSRLTHDRVSALKKAN